MDKAVVGACPLSLKGLSQVHAYGARSPSGVMENAPAVQRPHSMSQQHAPSPQQSKHLVSLQPLRHSGSAKVLADTRAAAARVHKSLSLGQQLTVHKAREQSLRDIATPKMREGAALRREVRGGCGDLWSARGRVLGVSAAPSAEQHQDGYRLGYGGTSGGGGLNNATAATRVAEIDRELPCVIERVATTTLETTAECAEQGVVDSNVVSTLGDTGAPGMPIDVQVVAVAANGPMGDVTECCCMAPLSVLPGLRAQYSASMEVNYTDTENTLCLTPRSVAALVAAARSPLAVVTSGGSGAELASASALSILSPKPVVVPPVAGSSPRAVASTGGSTGSRPPPQAGLAGMTAAAMAPVAAASALPSISYIATVFKDRAKQCSGNPEEEIDAVLGDLVDDVLRSCHKESQRHLPLVSDLLVRLGRLERDRILEWLVQACDIMRFPEEVLFSAVLTLDRCCARAREPLPMDRMQKVLMAVVCTVIKTCAVADEIYNIMPLRDLLVHLSRSQVPYEEILVMEHQVLETLHFQVSTPSPLDFLDALCVPIVATREPLESSPPRCLASFLLQLSMFNAALHYRYPHAILATSAIYVALCGLQSSPMLRQALLSDVATACPEVLDLHDAVYICAMELHNLWIEFAATQGNEFPCLLQKFSERRLHAAVLFAPPALGTLPHPSVFASLSRALRKAWPQGQ